MWTWQLSFKLPLKPFLGFVALAGRTMAVSTGPKDPVMIMAIFTLDVIMDILFMNIVNIMTRSAGFLALINLLQIQDIFQTVGSVVTKRSECVRYQPLLDAKTRYSGNDQERKNTLNM